MELDLKSLEAKIHSERPFSLALLNILHFSSATDQCTVSYSVKPGNKWYHLLRKLFGLWYAWPESWYQGQSTWHQVDPNDIYLGSSWSHFSGQVVWCFIVWQKRVFIILQQHAITILRRGDAPISLAIKLLYFWIKVALISRNLRK
jgi:hypothetical protein